MGKHRKESEAEKQGHNPSLLWDSKGTPENKAESFDRYDKYLTDTAPEDASNPYKK